MSATLGIGAAAGPALSGVLFEHLGWRSVFWTSALLGSALLAAAALVVPESPTRTWGRFDVLGALLLSLALVTLLLAISKGGSGGWAGGRVLGLFAATVLVLAVWVPHELRVRRPVVDLRTSARRPVLLTNVASLLIGFSMSANMLTTTQQLQLPAASGHGFGLSPTVAGLGMLPAGLAMVVMSPVSAVITRRFGARASLLAGGLVLAGGYGTRLLLTGAAWQVVVGSAVVSVGTALAYAAIPLLVMRSVPLTETASANGLDALLRAIGTSSSSAAVGVVLASSTVVVGGVALPSLGTFLQLFWLAGAAALLAVGAATGIPARLPAPAGEGTGPSPADVPEAAEAVVPGNPVDGGPPLTATPR